MLKGYPMNNTQMTLENSVEEILSRYFGLTSLGEATDEQLYKAVLLCVRLPL